MAFSITKATTDDRVAVTQLNQVLSGKLIGDKSYLYQKLFDELYQHRLQLIIKICKNMKNKFILLFDKLLLKKCAIIESIFDQLKISVKLNTRVIEALRILWSIYWLG